MLGSDRKILRSFDMLLVSLVLLVCVAVILAVALTSAGPVLAAVQNADEEGRRLLELANRSVNQDVFEGIFIYNALSMYSYEDHSIYPRWTVAAVHVWQNGSRYRMEALGHEGRRTAKTIVFDGENVWFEATDGKWVKEVLFHPINAQAGFRRFGFGGWTLGAPDLLLENYTAKLVDTVYFGSRDAGVVEVRPREPGSQWKKMWIDRFTGQPLREEIFDPWGEMVAISLLAEYVPGRGAADTFFATPPESEVVKPESSDEPQPERIFTSLEEAQEAANGGIFAPKHIPAGYRLIAVRFSRPEVYELAYWNGLGLIRWVVQQGRVTRPNKAAPPRFKPLDGSGRVWGNQSQDGSAIFQWEPGRLVTLSGPVDLELLVNMVH